MCAHKGGKSIQKANCSLRPWAMKKWERQCRKRKRGEGLDSMFPFACYVLRRNNMIAAKLTCSKYSTDYTSQAEETERESWDNTRSKSTTAEPLPLVFNFLDSEL